MKRKKSRKIPKNTLNYQELKKNMKLQKYLIIS